MKLLHIIYIALGVILFASIADAAWNQTTGLSYLYYCYASYCKESHIKDWSCKYCKNNVTKDFQIKFEASNGTDAIFSYGGYDPTTDRIIIVFRGTEPDSLKDWLDDLDNMELVPWKGNSSLEVGDGWNKGYDSVRNQILSGAQLLNQTYPGKQLCITGHSLGAALAGVCAVDLIEEGYSNLLVYTYGEPRIGNLNFANYMQTILPNYYRVINDRDIVPKLPYQWMGFHHQTQEIWETPEGAKNFKQCSQTNGEDPTCSDSVDSESIFDHIHYYGVLLDCLNIF